MGSCSRTSVIASALTLSSFAAVAPAHAQLSNILGDAIGSAVNGIAGAAKDAINPRSQASRDAPKSNDGPSPIQSVTIKGKSYAFSQDDWLARETDGTEVYGEHRSFHQTADDDKGYINGKLIYIHTNKAAELGWIRVTQSACQGGDILMQSSGDGKHWGVTRYAGEKMHPNVYLHLYPATDTHRAGYLQTYYLCLWETSHTFAVPPASKQ